MKRFLELATTAGAATVLGGGFGYLWIGQAAEAMTCFYSVLLTLTFPWRRCSQRGAP
jgi:hypothetical protein